MSRRYLSTLTLSASAVALLSPIASVAEELAAAEGPRDYIGEPILVTGHAASYGSDDGSTATKTPTAIIDVPQTVTTITADQLEDQAITQLNEALRYIPGVSLGTGEGHRDQIVLRGQPTTADFYLDGLRDDAQYYRATYNTDRIEALKGANALIFGRGGGGGAVNRVSKSARFDGLAGQFDAALDTRGAFHVTGDVNQTFSDALAGRLAATYEEFANHRDAYEGRFIGLAPTLGVKLGEATTLKASYSYEDDQRVVDRGIPSLSQRPIQGYDRTFFGDPAFNRSTNSVHTARLRLDHDFGEGLTFNATGHFADYDKYYGNVVPTSASIDTVTLNGYTSGTDRRNWIGQANLVWDAEFGGVGSTLLAGVEYGDQFTAADRSGAVFGTAGVSSVTIDLGRTLALPAARVGEQTNASQSDLNTFSAYVQEQLDFGVVQFIGGLRYESFDLDTVNLRPGGLALSRKDEKVSPRFGAILKPMEMLSFYASYATSFLPQSGDQFTVLELNTAALEPEKFENLEAGVKYAVTPRLLATAAVFQLDRSNTRFVNNGGFTELSGASRTKGAEISLAGEILPQWAVNWGYTYLDGEITATTSSAVAGTRLQLLPRHQIALWNRYDLTDRIGLGAGLIHQSSQFAALSNATAGMPNNATVLPSYWRVDAAAYWTVSDAISLQLNIENLTGATYYASAHNNNNIQPGKPFTAKLGIRLTL